MWNWSFLSVKMNLTFSWSSSFSSLSWTPVAIHPPDFVYSPDQIFQKLFQQHRLNYWFLLTDCHLLCRKDSWNPFPFFSPLRFPGIFFFSPLLPRLGLSTPHCCSETLSWGFLFCQRSRLLGQTLDYVSEVLAIDQNSPIIVVRTQFIGKLVTINLSGLDLKSFFFCRVFIWRKGFFGLQSLQSSTNFRKIAISHG